MKTVRELFGEDWAQLDVVTLDGPTKRRKALADLSVRERRVFGVAFNALLRSLLLIDGDKHLQRWDWDGARYRPLRSGMFTLGDIHAEYLLQRTGKYVYGFAGGCARFMADLFRDVAVRDPEPGLPQDVGQIFDTIRCITENAMRNDVQAIRLRSFPRRNVFEDIAFLAEAGLKIVEAWERDNADALEPLGSTSTSTTKTWYGQVAPEAEAARNR
jgi:hypothetical protein